MPMSATNVRQRQTPNSKNRAHRLSLRGLPSRRVHRIPASAGLPTLQPSPSQRCHLSRLSPRKSRKTAPRWGSVGLVEAVAGPGECPVHTGLNAVQIRGRWLAATGSHSQAIAADEVRFERRYIAARVAVDGNDCGASIPRSIWVAGRGGQTPLPLRHRQMRHNASHKR